MYQAVIKRWPVYLVSACTFAIVIFRAVHQAVTIDEADTFLSFVHQALPMVWYPSPNNHVLNSISEAMSVHLFGVSPFSIRVPAVIGAGIYIGVCATFAIRFMDDSLRAVILLTVLTANPFIMDYLVAARGYSLALGFLVLTVYLLSKARTQAGSARLRSLAFGSASSGLAISANFSFAFAVACTLIVFGLVIVWDQKHKLAICVALFLPFITRKRGS